MRITERLTFRIEMSSLIVIGIAAVSAVFAYGNLHGRLSSLEREHEGARNVMREEADEVLDTMKNQVEGQREEIRKLFAGVIVLATDTCDTLGPDWTSFRELDGRFPLGSGQTEEQLDGKTVFKINTVGGAYVHRLTEPEMPKHAHPYEDYHFNNRRGGDKYGDDDDKDRFYIVSKRNTTTRGQGMAHNNMPPYRVVSFCYKAGQLP